MLTIPKVLVWVDAEQLELSYEADDKTNLEYTLLGLVSAEYVHCYPAIPLLCRHQTNVYIYPPNSCPRGLIAVLFAIHINWTQPKCLSIAE